MNLTTLKNWETHPWLRWWPLLSWLALLLVWIGTAWVCDDAYITFRTVDNLLQGHGAVFNVGERVQSYTHPLWMLLHVPAVGLLGDAYYATLLLSLACTFATTALLARLLRNRLAWGLVPLLLICSKAFVEYSSSGLENPLTQLLLVLFAYVLLERRDHPRQLLHLSLLLALLFTSRMDAILMLAPALAWRCWETRSWRTVWLVALGFLPIVAWEAFSIVYYGFPFPNTAYAKLGAGIDNGQLLQQGVYYFLDSLKRDPLTLPLTLLGVVVGLSKRQTWPLSLGVLLYLVYVLRIGGDFMTGRFFNAPFTLGLLVLLYHMRDRALGRGSVFGWALVPVALAALFNAGTFALQLMGPPAQQALAQSHGIANERAFYSAGTGLVHAFMGHHLPVHPGVDDGRKMAASPERVHIVYALGFPAYFAGPDRFLLDRYALSDALMARLPRIHSPRQRPGHYERVLPAGFVESLRTNSNVLEDPALRSLYADLLLISRGPIWSSERWAAIWWQNTAPRQDFSRYATPVTQRHVIGDTSATRFSLQPESGLRILPQAGKQGQIQFTMQGLCDVALTQHWHDGRVTSIWASKEFPDDVPFVQTFDWAAGIDSLSIYPIGECPGGVLISEIEYP